MLHSLYYGSKQGWPKPNLGTAKFSGFAMFRQVSVLFALGLNGFCLGFRKKGGKSLKNTEKSPKKLQKKAQKKVSFVVSVSPCFARIRSDSFVPCLPCFGHPWSIPDTWIYVHQFILRLSSVRHWFKKKINLYLNIKEDKFFVYFVSNFCVTFLDFLYVINRPGENIFKRRQSWW